MPPSARLDRVFDSFGWVEYFRGTPADEVVADELEAGLGGSKKRVSGLKFIAAWVGGSL